MKGQVIIVLVREKIDLRQAALPLVQIGEMLLHVFFLLGLWLLVGGVVLVRDALVTLTAH